MTGRLRQSDDAAERGGVEMRAQGGGEPIQGFCPPLRRIREGLGRQGRPAPPPAELVHEGGAEGAAVEEAMQVAAQDAAVGRGRG